jgi:uncharacterized membrane protein YdjX (TVP38/TMEM64 family)
MRFLLLLLLLFALIIGPFLLFEQDFERFGNSITHGELARWPAAVALGGFLALDIFLPVPSSMVSTAAGALLGFAVGTAVIWTGMTAGCLLGYAIGARSSGLARRLVGAQGLERASRVATDYGDWGIVIARPVPVLAEASVILAGLVRTPFTRFILVAALSNLGIAAAYAAIGAFSMGLGSFLLTFAGAIAVPGLAMLGARMFERGAPGAEGTEETEVLRRGRRRRSEETEG